MSKLLSRLLTMTDEEAALFSHYDSENDALVYEDDGYVVFLVDLYGSPYFSFTIVMPFGTFQCFEGAVLEHIIHAFETISNGRGTKLNDTSNPIYFPNSIPRYADYFEHNYDAIRERTSRT